MGEFLDYYKILEIDKNSSQLEIRQRYLILAFKYHPDKNVHLSNEERIEYENKFKIITNAFRVLSDPIEKKNYDKIYESKKNKYNVFYSYQNGNHNFTVSSIILKMLNKVFSEEQLQNGKEFLNIFNKFLNINHYTYNNLPEILINYKCFFERKNTERKNIEVKNIERKKSYRYEVNVKNDTNNDSSYESNEENTAIVTKNNKKIQNILSNSMNQDKNTDKVVCADRDTNEDIIYNINVSLDDIYNGVSKQLDVPRKIVCYHCLGKGYLGYGVDMSLCHLCKGVMKLNETKIFPIDIRENKIVLNGEGNQSLEGVFSDIIININSKPDPLFRRHDNYDLIYDYTISLIELYSEISINLTHLDKKKYVIKYSYLKNFENRNKLLDKMMLRIRDLGLPISSSGRRGDLYIKLNIYLPELNNESIKELTRMKFLEKPIIKYFDNQGYVEEIIANL